VRPQPPVTNTDAHLAQISGQLDELIGILRQEHAPAEPTEPQPADAPAEKPEPKKAPAKKAATRKRVTGQ
jgi:hypothetical protein